MNLVKIIATLAMISERAGDIDDLAPLHAITPNFAGAIVQEVFTELVEAIGWRSRGWWRRGLGVVLGHPPLPALRAATPHLPLLQLTAASRTHPRHP